MKPFVITLFLLVSGFYASAQNYLFEKGQNGFHLAGQVAFPKTSTVYAILPGYTWNGRFTMGAGVGLEDGKNSSLTSYSVKPMVNYLFLKQTKGGAPLSMGLGAGYQSNWIKNNKDIKIGTLSFDLGLHHRVYMADKSSLIPGAYVGWAQTHVDNRMKSSKESQYMGAIQLAILMNKFHITPAFHFAKQANLAVVSLGFIFPESK